MIQPEVLRIYISRYKHKASVLAEIHSALARKNERWDLGYTCAIVFLTGTITFLGFMGTDRILDAFGLHQDTGQLVIDLKPTTQTAPASALAASTPMSPPADTHQTYTSIKTKLDFGLNVAVLLLFIVSLSNLIFRWKELYTSHFQGVVKLRQFTRWLEELLLLENLPVDLGRLKHIRHRYEAIVEPLPPNSDKDYIRAKEKMAEGVTNTSPTLQAPSKHGCDDCSLVIRIVESSPAIMEVLVAASKLSPKLWLGGGSIRTVTWQYLTGRTTKPHDFDIVYFDASNVTEEYEKATEKALRDSLPKSFDLSVKNQARMHSVNGEPQRKSLEEAISNWPEKATAMAVRLENGKLQLMSPYGCDDVLDMVIQPTPYHQKNPAAYQKRLASKAWKTLWPEVEIRSS